MSELLEARPSNPEEFEGIEDDTDRPMKTRLKEVIPFGAAVMGVTVEGGPLHPLSSGNTMTVTGGDANGKNKQFDDPSSD